MLRLLLVGALTASLVTPSVAQVAEAPGFAPTDTLDLAGGRAYGTLADGRYVSFDGLAFELYGPDGILLATFGTLATSVFPSFVEVHPSETYAVVGESSNGELFRVDLVAGTVSPLANLFFNYDLDWVPGTDTAYVSAALGGFGAGNDLVRLDALTGATDVVAHVAGPSGPVGVAGDGGLYYVTAYDGNDWPPPLAEEELLFWDAAELAAAGGGIELDESDADVLAAGLDGSSSIAVDLHSERLFLVNANFQGYENEVLAFDLGGTWLDTVAESFTSLGNLEVFEDGADATFAGYQPSNARLFVQNTDFGSALRDRVRLEPARPTSEFDGPPAGQTGPASVTIRGAEPNGNVSIMVAFTSDLATREVVNELGYGFPFFTAFDLDDLWRRTVQLTTDGNGEYVLNYIQPSSLEGMLVFQAIVYDGVGVPLGTSEFVVNQ